MNWKDVLHQAKHGSPAPAHQVQKTDAQWQAELGPEAYHVLRQHGTERAFTGEYCQAHDPGLYACRGCGNELFDSSEKFDSGTGWPSFTVPVRDNAVAYHADYSYGMTRVEVTCNDCGGHLGHVFPDGPAPTGLRYCLNSAAIKLVEAGKP